MLFYPLNINSIYDYKKHIFGEKMNTNPLKQYFRRPTIYIKLPSEGKYYPAGAIDLPDNKELPVYPMTAIDEITSKTPDALFNGIAITEIIKSCIPNIKDPWAIPAIDLDAILISIRAATNGNMLDLESVCPACTEDASYNINLVGLLSKLKPEYDDVIKINDLTFKFNPMLYKKVNEINLVQFEIEKTIRNIENITDGEERLRVSGEAMKKLNELSILLVTETIDSISTPTEIVTEKEHINDFLRNSDKNTYDILKNTVIKLREGSQLKPLQVKCIHCQHEYDQTLTLNVTDFFD
jgi:hypothetical protein